MCRGIGFPSATHAERNCVPDARGDLNYSKACAMLSATMGPMFFGPNPNSFEMQDYGDQHPLQPGMFAPQSFEMRMEGPAGWNGWMIGSMPGDWHDDPMVFGRPAPDQESLGYESPSLKHSALTSEAKQPTTNLGTAAPNAGTILAPGYTLIIEEITYVPQSATSAWPAGGQQHVDSPSTGSTIPNYNKESLGGHDPEPTGKLGYLLNGGTSSTYGLTVAAPISTQYVSHQTELTSQSNGAVRCCPAGVYLAIAACERRRERFDDGRRHGQ